MTSRVAVDIGGTFTDIVFLNEETGGVDVLKIETTPRDPSQAFSSGISQILEKTRASAESVRSIFHATTIASNAVLEQKGAKTGLVTTEGFRDVLEIGRQQRPSLYDFSTDRPVPLVPRYLRKEVRERTSFEGKAIKHIDISAVSKVARELKSQEVKSVAICFLFSYVNSSHEAKAKQILKRMLPRAYIVASHEILPEYREFDRMSTTVLSAYLAPIVGAYTQQLVTKLKRIHVNTDGLYIMQSGGGLMRANLAREKAHTMLESGPAAGVIATAYLGSQLLIDDIISFDMGGTTAKASLIKGGRYQITTEYEIGTGFNRTFVARSAGYPVKSPIIDLAEVGAGGGSIAWVDNAGGLKVGPRSAGAVPGPACYGKSGDEPTITDAHVILSALDADYFLGGAISLRPELSTKAIQKKIAKPLGISLSAAARGIIDVANSSMVRMIRVVSVSRGFDVRDFTLVAFGGAGPLHAAELARELRMRQVIVPPNPGVFSALGLLYSDVKSDFGMTRIIDFSPTESGAINQIYDKLERMALEWLRKEGVPREKQEIVRTADMRYPGQYYQINIEIGSEKLSSERIQELVQDFHTTHNRMYGYAFEDEIVQIVNFRVTAVGGMLKPPLKSQNLSSSEVESRAIRTRRKVYFKEFESYADCDIIERTKLSPGNCIKGPAIIEQIDSTTVVLPNQIASVDKFSNIIITNN
ncbi:MAG: hydantoinase/oxoprolinase family protein [archaeon]|nr:hydantoinase/oxoprolinase family protein [archaeon]